MPAAPALRLSLLACWLLPALLAAAAPPAAVVPHSGRAFDLRFEAGTLSSLQSPRDPRHTPYLASGARLGHVAMNLRRAGGPWQPLRSADLAAKVTSDPDGHRTTAIYLMEIGGTPALQVTISLGTEGDALHWSVDCENRLAEPLEIGDLALPLPMNSSFRRSTEAVLKHSFISGHGSFLYWLRPDSTRPFLTLVPTDDTAFEYWEAHDGYQVFIHSAAAGAAAHAKGTRWRQPHTSAMLAPRGQPGHRRSYGCKFRWADGHEDVRRILFEENGIDIQVVPGMTVPSGLAARIAVRSKQPLTGVEAEFPAETRIEALETRGAYQIYQISFSRLGENRLTVRYGRNHWVQLEFFATEPLETLLTKRARFIAKCQHLDPQKWYHGLFGEWNMETRTLLGPDNYDRIKGWRIYEVSCDDPGLSKPAFLAAKNARFPDQQQVAALDVYLEHFVWGGLQRSTGESHPYGIYGIPDWKTNRDSPDPGAKGQLHIWRPYDYPHVLLVYLSMYQIAANHPQIRTALTADQYLRRAHGTAKAMFTVPMDVIQWSAYHTGFYNELVIVDVIEALESAGLRQQADELRGHWERKVRVFANDKPDLFRSEYPFDSTGFESTHALARYALRNAEGPHAARLGVTPANAKLFMETQLEANIFCRGSIEPAYYYLGSDYRGNAGNAYTLTYMSQMGGWALLDYALNFAAEPAPCLRLGYASFLAPWALMNTGTETSNFGYWYPGPDNDGACGGGFEPAPFGTTWLEQPHRRGAWYYSCETDLGYCAALRAAATILLDDPIFGRICLGGDLQTHNDRLQVVPRDGVRQRLHARLATGNAGLVLESDRFAAGQPMEIAADGRTLTFTVESANPAPHPLRLQVSAIQPGTYAISAAGGAAVSFVAPGSGEIRVELPAVENGQVITIRPAAAAAR